MAGPAAPSMSVWHEMNVLSFSSFFPYGTVFLYRPVRKLVVPHSCPAAETRPPMIYREYIHYSQHLPRISSSVSQKGLRREDRGACDQRPRAVPMDDKTKTRGSNQGGSAEPNKSVWRRCPATNAARRQHRHRAPARARTTRHSGPAGTYGACPPFHTPQGHRRRQSHSHRRRPPSLPPLSPPPVPRPYRVASTTVLNIRDGGGHNVGGGPSESRAVRANENGGRRRGNAARPRRSPPPTLPSPPARTARSADVPSRQRCGRPNGRPPPRPRYEGRSQGGAVGGTPATRSPLRSP